MRSIIIVRLSIALLEYAAIVVLFLDFDGVLHQFDRMRGVLVLIPEFERVMRHFPAVDIVISSTWREAHSLAELRSFFSLDIAERIVDVTPVLDFRHHAYVREAEISAWLSDAGRAEEDWIAVDDTEWFFSPACCHLILVDTNLGFNEATERELRRRLA